MSEEKKAFVYFGLGTIFGFSCATIVFALIGMYLD